MPGSVQESTVYHVIDPSYPLEETPMRRIHSMGYLAPRSIALRRGYYGVYEAVIGASFDRRAGGDDGGDEGGKEQEPLCYQLFSERSIAV